MSTKTIQATVHRHVADDTDDTRRLRRPTTKRQSREETETFLADLDDYLTANANMSRFTISPKHYR